MGYIVLPKIMRALGSRNYRLFFFAQAFSQVGLWMQRVAMGWLIYRLTNAPSALGMVDFAACIPSLILVGVTGPVLSRVDLRKALFVSQLLLSLSAALIAFLTWTQWINYTWILWISLFLGTVNAFDMTARQSLVVYMVDYKEDMSNALALNSSLFNVARLIGPSIAGVTIHHIGEALCFALNSLTYLATIFALRVMHMKEKPIIRRRDGGEKPKREGIIQSLMGGVRYVRAFPPFFYSLMMATAAGIFGFPYIVLMPAMARDALGGNAKTMGVLLFAIGVGALAGSLMMAARKSPIGLDRWQTRTAMAFGVFVMLFALTRTVAFAMMALVPLGFCMVTTLIACNTFLQSLVFDEQRSSMMSLYICCSVGIPPFGSILVGRLGDMIGTPGALFLSGALCLLSCYYFARKMKKYRLVIIKQYKRSGFNLDEAKAQRW